MIWNVFLNRRSEVRVLSGALDKTAENKAFSMKCRESWNGHEWLSRAMSRRRGRLDFAVS